MLERIVNRISDRALASDVAKLDMSRRPSEITERLDISYNDDNENGHKFDVYLREDFGLPAREYKYKGLIADCGLLHFYKPSIAYWGMRGMIFPKGYKKDRRYAYLQFEKNESISKLPKVALITNRKDVLRKMTYHFERVLKSNGVQYRLYDGGADGHTGIIFVPYEEHNQDTMKKITWYLQE